MENVCGSSKCIAPLGLLILLDYFATTYKVDWYRKCKGKLFVGKELSGCWKVSNFFSVTADPSFVIAGNKRQYPPVSMLLTSILLFVSSSCSLLWLSTQWSCSCSRRDESLGELLMRVWWQCSTMPMLLMLWLMFLTSLMEVARAATQETLNNSRETKKSR